MNRRQFTTALGALAATPALPLKAMATAAPVATGTVPNAARFWAIYMSHLHGTCTPASLSVMTGIDKSLAKTYLNNLVAEGIITPTRLFGKIPQSKSLKSEPSNFKERLKKFLAEDEVEQERITEESTEEPEIVCQKEDEA